MGAWNQNVYNNTAKAEYSGKAVRYAAFLAALLYCLSPLATPPAALALGIIMALTIGNPDISRTRKASGLLLKSCVVLLGFSMNLAIVLHAGENGLHEALAGFGGFDHNAQSMRVVTLLEHRYAAFDGLNLTWESLEGLAKHNGPLLDPPEYIAAFDAQYPLDLARQPSAEAQVAALADDIAYNTHDLDDGLRAGLFGFADIAALPMVGEALAEAQALTPEANRVRHELSRRVINALVHDVIGESAARLLALAPLDAEAIRGALGPVIGFSGGMGAANTQIKAFLFERMYRHWRVNRMAYKAQMVTRAMGTLLLEKPFLLPEDWRVRAGEPQSPQAAGAVRDYVAGMTDRYALDEYARLTDPSAPA